MQHTTGVCCQELPIDWLAIDKLSMAAYVVHRGPLWDSLHDYYMCMSNWRQQSNEQLQALRHYTQALIEHRPAPMVPKDLVLPALQHSSMTMKQQVSSSQGTSEREQTVLFQPPSGRLA